MTRLLVVLAALGGLVPLAANAESSSPGTLVSQTPIAGAPEGASAWRISYRSLAESGASVEISGVVVVPKGAAPKEGRDVVSWGHSTVGIALGCAPSTQPDVFKNIAGLPDMLKHGYVVTATDFQGLGTPGPHPYMVGVSSGRAMLDAVRAARALKPADAGKRFALWGESQGAHAVLWAAQLAPTYVPELQLVGAAAAAPPTDLIANFDAITNPTTRALMTAYTSGSWSQVYHIPLSTFANWFGRVLIHRLDSKCVRLDPVSSLSDVVLLVASHQLPEHLGDPWTKPLKDNSVKPVHIAVPMLIAQGGQDNVVRVSVTQDFVKKSCQAGDAIRYVAVPDASHMSTATQSADTAVAWIAERFDGKPPMSDCATIEGTVGAGGKPAPGAAAAPDKRT